MSIIQIHRRYRAGRSPFSYIEILFCIFGKWREKLAAQRVDSEASYIGGTPGCAAVVLTIVPPSTLLWDKKAQEARVPNTSTLMAN